MEPSLLMAPATPQPERDRPISKQSDDNDSPSSLPPSPATAVPAPTEEPPTAAVYCLCRKPDDGSLMVECGGCAKWFHTRCMGLKPLRSPRSVPIAAGAAAAIEAEATTTDFAHPAAPAAAVEWTLSIPEDWRCPRCAPGSGVPRGRKRHHGAEQEKGEEGEDEDSEAEEAAVEGEVGALLREQGLENGGDEELTACFRREVWRRRALGAWF